MLCIDMFSKSKNRRRRGVEPPDLATPAGRLRQARIAAGFDSATAAAEALRIGESTYRHHENGTAGFSAHAPHYAKRFSVALDWLMTGAGKASPRTPNRGRDIEVFGFVEAADSVTKVEDDWTIEHIAARLPEPQHLLALKIRGDSQRPRFLPSEYILYDKRPLRPEELLDQFAIVQMENGTFLIKTLREGRRGYRWTLESLNARPLFTSDILCVYRYCGCLPASDE